MSIDLSYAAIILMGVSVFIISSALFMDEDQYKAGQQIDDADGKNDDLKNQDFIIRVSRPFFRRYVSPIVSNMKGRKKIKEKYKRKLASAGLTKILTPEDFYSFKLFLILAFPIVFLGSREFLEEDWPMQLIPLMAVIGYFYPDIWIKGKIQKRQEGVTEEMPFIVDMLALSVEAGLDFVAAMAKVMEKAPAGPLAEEFEIMLKEIKVGASRAEALRNLSWRIDLVKVSSFCATLIAADSVGASVGPILKVLSNEIRQQRSTEIEKKGAQAATKMLFPMMFLIIPAVFMMIAAPLVVEWVSGQ